MVELEISQWLSPDDIEGESMIVIFTNEGEYREINLKDGEQKQVFEIGVLLPNNTEKDWTMNKKSQIAVSTAYGLNTAKWVGKPVEIFKIKQQVFNQLKDVIYASIPQSKGNTVDNVEASLKKSGAKVKRK